MSDKKKEKKKAEKVYTKKELSFLELLINTPSPTWFEYTGQQVWMDYIKPYVDEIYTDTYGTAVGIINPDAEYKVVIEAHCDEISWFVNYITDNGLIHVIRNGGSDHLGAPSQRVHIHTQDKGIINWVFGRPAIHTRKWGKEEQTPKVTNITIDVWAKNKEEIEKMGIEVGNPITYDAQFMILNDRYAVGRALDNRVWGFMIAQVARLLKKNKKKLPFGLYIVNSVQEEIWLRWARMIAEHLSPDVAIITDVGHDTSTPMIDKTVEGDTMCGKWPMLTVWPAVQNNLLKHIKSTAKKKKIDYQMCAASSYTGTDTDAFAYSNSGVASALISLPLRYMHTTVEMVDMDDISETIKLMYESVCSIKKGQDFGYLK
jgi:putative aminopeptidase FrvX